MKMAMALDPSFTILDSFNNGLTLTCDGGAVYNPTVTDGRILRVQFHDGTSWRLITPDSVIRSVPYAGYSESASKLGDKYASDFILKNEVNGNASCESGFFLTWNSGTRTFGCASAASGSGTVTNVTSTNSFLSVTNGTTAPLLTLNVGTGANTVAAGNDARFSDPRIPSGSAGGDLNGNYPNPDVAKIKNVGLLITSITSGQYLKYNGTNWINSAIAQGDVTGLTTALSGKIDQSNITGKTANKF